PGPSSHCRWGGLRREADGGRVGNVGGTRRRGRPSLQRRPDEHGPAPGGASGKVFATLPNKARQEEWSLVDFLARVVAEQSSATNDRRLAARLRYARFPFRKTLEDFDFEFQPRVDRKLIGRGVAALHRREQPVLFLG